MWNRASKGKVRNAKKTIVEGIEFDSKLEAKCYVELKKVCKNVEIKKQLVLQNEFTFFDETIKPITWTPDFFLPDYNTIIETKGIPNESFPLRLKLAKKYIVDNNLGWKILILTNERSIDLLCKNISKLNNSDFSTKKFKILDEQLKKEKNGKATNT